MIIQIFGKLHLKGISKKTGKDYDFAKIHYAIPKRGVIGRAAVTKDINLELIDIDGMTVPGEYVVEFDDDGEIISLAPVSATANPKG